MIPLCSRLHACSTVRDAGRDLLVRTVSLFCHNQVREFHIFNNVIKTPGVLPILFQPISIMRAGSWRNLPLFSPPPEISLLCDGDSVGQSTCASHLNPLIYHRVPPRNKRISLRATAAPEPAPANANKAKL